MSTILAKEILLFNVTVSMGEISQGFTPRERLTGN